MWWALSALTSALGAAVLVLVVGAALFDLAHRVFVRRRLDLQGRVALVTGAGHGIGEQLAVCLARAGAHLVLWDIQGDALARVAAAVRALRPDARVITHVVDVGDESAVHRAAELAARELGPALPISVLVNNAGVVQGAALPALSAAQVERTLRVNTLAHFWTLRAFLPGMLQRGDGAVVTVSSLMALMASARLADYCASKWALLGMHDSLALEVRRGGHDGVRLLAVCPYATATGMFSGIMQATRFERLVARAVPQLDPAHVARETVAALQRGEQLLVLPRWTRYAMLLLRAMPVPLYLRALELFGGRSGMDTFVGRRGAGWDAARGTDPSSSLPVADS